MTRQATDDAAQTHSLQAEEQKEKTFLTVNHSSASFTTADQLQRI